MSNAVANTLAALLQLGIDEAKAQHAALRYEDNLDGAADWCFGAGATWTPESEKPLPPPLPARHVERARTPDASRISPRSKPDNIQFGSNNPFLAQSPAPRAQLLPPSYPSTYQSGAISGAGALGVTVDDEDDAEMAKAIAMSQETRADGPPDIQGEEEERDGQSGTRVTVHAADDLDVDMEEAEGSNQVAQEQRRDERERSTRATAPPPSPDRNRDREGASQNTVFGPSAQDEMGQTALVPFTGPGSMPNISKEDEELNRAIQDSLMTASFHSQSAAPVERPSNSPRQKGAPLVFLSESNKSTYAANFLQAVYAVPQLRRVILESIVDGIEPWDLAVPLRDLQRTFQLVPDEGNTYLEVDALLSDLRRGNTPNQLPPKVPLDDLTREMGNMIRATVSNTSRQLSEPLAELWQDPTLLLHTTVHPPMMSLPHIVYFSRRGDLPDNIHAHLADILWQSDKGAIRPQGMAPPDCIEKLPDMLTCDLNWSVGARRELWKIEERVVLDRYMKENKQWSIQIRAQQSLAAGNVRRIKEQIERLTMYGGENYQHSISALIAHYNDSTDPSNDRLKQETRIEMKAKLETTLQTLQSMTSNLQTQLGEQEDLATGRLFQTDDPDKNRHVYMLKAVLMHDGGIVPGRHLYMYVQGDDERWWRIQDHEIQPSTLEEVKTDRTGLFMDGGPYCLIYARVSPRVPPVQEESIAKEQPVTDDEAADLLRFDDDTAIDASQENASGIEDWLKEEDEPVSAGIGGAK